jgi:hypothetical protein
MVYVLLEDVRAAASPKLARAALGVEGVDLAMWMSGDEAVIASADAELRFAPGGPVRDGRGGEWHITGDLAVIAAAERDGLLVSDDYPNALARVWAALSCETSGDVLLSAGAGWEFADWGGVDHVGGGSHGSLHRSDSVGALAYCGVNAPAGANGSWSIADITPTVWAHFGVEP